MRYRVSKPPESALNPPKTLLEMAGAERSIAPWNQLCLVLVDAQMEYVSGRLPLHGIDAALAECARLLTLAREAGAPIVHVVHEGRSGGLFDAEGPGGAIAAAVAPRAGETIVRKRLPNAFAATNLEATLKATGRTQLVIAGFATHMCVSATARSALDHGYLSTVIAAACATRDLPSPQGGVIAASVLHEVALAELADRFATVVGSADVWVH
jgi:nicotinamidase-related amidase